MNFPKESKKSPSGGSTKSPSGGSSKSPFQFQARTGVQFSKFATKAKARVKKAKAAVRRNGDEGGSFEKRTPKVGKSARVLNDAGNPSAQQRAFGVMTRGQTKMQKMQKQERAKLFDVFNDGGDPLANKENNDPQQQPRKSLFQNGKHRRVGEGRRTSPALFEFPSSVKKSSETKNLQKQEPVNANVSPRNSDAHGQELTDLASTVFKQLVFGSASPGSVPGSVGRKNDQNVDNYALHSPSAMPNFAEDSHDLLTLARQATVEKVRRGIEEYKIVTYFYFGRLALR
jgi:hypothetical protein